MQNQIHILTLKKKSMIKTLNLKLMILLEYKNIKTFFLVIKKVKDTALWTYVISNLIGEEIARTFYEKELQKTNQKEFRIEKVIKRKVVNFTLNKKDTIISLMGR